MEMTLNQYAAKANTFATYNKELGPYYTILGLCGEAGETANRLKKVYRDNNGVLTKEASKDLAYELGNVLWYLSQSASQLGLTLEQIAELNISKLYKRKYKTDLKGSDTLFNDKDFAHYISDYEKQILKDLFECWTNNAFELYKLAYPIFKKCVENSLKRLGLSEYKHQIICDDTNNTEDIIEQQKLKISLHFRHTQGYYHVDYILPDDFSKLQKQAE